MFIQRVQVANFRGLQDVDITFEKDFYPTTFLLASKNGGGKSTLLQLIFTLLHCRNPKYLDLLENTFNHFELTEFDEEKPLAIIDIWDGEKSIRLEFLGFGSNYTKNIVLTGSGFSNICKKARIIDLIFIAKSESNSSTLFCKCDMKREDTFLLLQNLSKQVFLSAPFDKKFIKDAKLKFLAKDKFKSSLLNINIYEQFNEYHLLKLIKNTWKHDNNTIADFGFADDTLQKLLTDIHLLFPLDKKLKITDFKSISFSQKNKILNLDDLSKGELKLLSIYTWITYFKIENSIILMDNLEDGLSNDLQYIITENLKKWSPSNQYIIATHSYSMCEALTPKHVKELNLCGQ